MFTNGKALREERRAIEADLRGDEGRGARHPVRNYIEEISREPLLTPAEEHALASRLGVAAREARLAAHTLPEALGLTIRSLSVSAPGMEPASRERIKQAVAAQHDETKAGWERFQRGEISPARYLQTLRENATFLEAELRSNESWQAHAVVDANVTRARAVGVEVRQLLAAAGPGSEAVRQWEETHHIPADVALALSDRVVAAQDEAAPDRDRFLRANTRLVVAIARQHMRPGRELLDLISYGNEGLLRAVDRFDADRGTKFSTYASFWINQAISRSFMNENTGVIHVPRYAQVALLNLEREARTQRVNPEELAAQKGWSERTRRNVLGAPRSQQSLDVPSAGRDGEKSLSEGLAAPPRSADHRHTLTQLEKIVAQLPRLLDQRQRTVVAMIHGLKIDADLLVPGANPEEGPHTLKDTGRLLGITRERTRQILMSTQEIFGQASAIDNCPERTIRHAERALHPGEVLLVRSALEATGEELALHAASPRVQALDAGSRKFSLEPQERVYRLMQLGLERLVEQVAIDDLSPQAREEIANRLTGVERMFFRAYWLRPTALPGELSGEFGMTGNESHGMRESLRARILRPLTQRIVRDLLRE